MVPEIVLNSLAASALSLAFSVVIAITGKAQWILRQFAARTSEVQALHSDPVPRLGSIGIMIACGILIWFHDSSALSLWALLPLVSIGFIEDLGWGVRPIWRLIAVASSAVIQIGATSVWIDRIDFTSADYFLSSWLVGPIVTVFVITAVSHSFNLIDGLNGLASITAMSAAAALTYIGVSSGQFEASLLSLVLCFSVVGFLPVNFPKAYVFLGDTGAYLVGFIIAWSGVSLINGSTEVSPWAVLLAVFLPTTDTAASIMRRLWAGVPVGSPDREHLHHLAFDLTSWFFQGTSFIKWANPAATVLLLVLSVLPPALSAVLWQDSFLCICAIGALSVVYAVVYRSLGRMIRQ